MGRVWVSIVADRTVEIKAGYKRAIDQAVRKCVLDIEANAKRNVRDMDAIDTGALMNSIYSVIERRSGYDQAGSKAKAEAAKGSRKLRRKGEAKPKPFEMRPQIHAGTNEGIVAVGAEYGEIIHEGTTRMPGRPFLAKAAETVFPVFDQVVRDMINKET